MKAEREVGHGPLGDRPRAEVQRPHLAAEQAQRPHPDQVVHLHLAHVWSREPAQCTHLQQGNDRRVRARDQQRKCHILEGQI